MILLPNNLHQHPLPPSPVELVIENVLPRAEVQLAVGDGDDDFAAYDRVLRGVASIPPAILARRVSEGRGGSVAEEQRAIAVSAGNDRDRCVRSHCVPRSRFGLGRYQPAARARGVACWKPCWQIIMDQSSRMRYGQPDTQAANRTRRHFRGERSPCAE